ncbi:MAG: phosphotyrosine protein phosphatase [Ruegeria sp.]|uniref:phosphotyrosine protein phosphatase n=1 Tax=Ruegeria sp. TaxID=1879320 RepID=UPI00349EC8A9
MTNVLFLCGKARKRSPTAADIVARWPGFSTDFAGLGRDADEQVSSEHIEWADVIVVMERRQRKRLSDRFGHLAGDTRVAVLGVPDRFEYMEQALIDLIEPRLRRILGAPA